MKIKNLLNIDCKQIEKLAKLGYWEWHSNKKELLISENLQNMLDFTNKKNLPFSIISYLKNTFQYKECKKLISYLRSLKNTNHDRPHLLSINFPDSTTHYFSCKSNISKSSKGVIISGLIQDVTESTKYSLLKEKEIKFEKQISQIASRFLGQKSFKEDVIRTLSEIGLLLNSSQVKVISIQYNKIKELYYWKNENFKTPKHSVLESLPPHELKFFIELLKEKKVICLNNKNDVPDAATVVKSFFEKSIHTSVILSAISMNNQTIGALIIAKQDLNKWDFSDIHIAKMTSLLLANALKQNKIQKELSSSQNRLQFALLAGSLGTWEYNILEKSFYVDEKFANIFGFSNNTLNRIPNWLYKNIHKDHLAKYIEEIDSCVLGVKKYYSIELKVKCADGKFKWVHDWGIVTKTDEEGYPSTMVGVIQDITTNKRLENELLNAKIKAENNEKLKTAFLANVSHEIRTPMNGITGFAELLYNNRVAENDQQKYFEVIWKNSTRLLQLINNILDISRLESKQIVLYEREHSLNQILSELERQIKTHNSENKDISIFFHSDFDEQMAYIKIDDNRLKQILNNIIDNAIKFTPKGEVSISCKLNNNGQIEFCINDTGNGIDKTQFKNIFKRFTQTENAIKLNKGGAGLGLPITKGLLDIMKGDIWFTSKKTIGSTFNITIPYKPTRVSVQNIG